MTRRPAANTTTTPAAKATAASLQARIGTSLHAPRKAAATRYLRELNEAAGAAGQAKEIARLLGDGKIAGFLAAIMADSPFLRSLIVDSPERLALLMASDPDDRLAAILAAVATRAADEAELMAALRQARAEIALLVALADLGDAWSVDRVMEALTLFADAAVTAAVSFLLRREHEAGAIRLPDLDEPGKGSGWIILAMGKHGGGELNYSSDIDLISLFDPAGVGLSDPTAAAAFYVRLTRGLVHILQERTADGYVFRTDLRLRPDPGSTAVSIATEAALLYYESQGQNWERAALIKARPVAGDIAAGGEFLRRLTPYIWRKYLDYAAIADIHSIKRQIHDHRGHETVAIAGHNLKLGRGGIREIEFFVQTQQLIAGGRKPLLRGRQTLAMLAALVGEGWVAPEAAAALADAYRLLRRFEHRLQMVNDEQTHTLPKEPADLAVIARLLGLRSLAALEKLLKPKLEAVQLHYARLFEKAPALSVSAGNLVFTGDEDDPETLATIGRLGFVNPETVSQTIRGWHHGRYPAMRSAAAREHLTELTPVLLETLARSGGPDAAFLAFDKFLSRLPAGLQLFALLAANPRLLDLIGLILGIAPRLADIVTRRPHVLDAVIEPAFFGSVPAPEALASHLRQTLDQARSYEDALDRARIFGQEQAFLIGARLLAGTIDTARAGRAYTDLADALVAEALRLSESAIRDAHGKMPEGQVAVVALGRLGGREMTAGSDLDLILLYDVTGNAPVSDGPRPLPPAQYYARLTQRLVAALSAPTAEGRLYEVDFRLRPSGNSGPLATSLKAFIEYQAGSAWTWERMALTRARVIAGDSKLTAAAEKAITTVLRTPRASATVAADVAEMRSMIEAEKGGGGLWDLKQVEGGLVDVEFIAQFLQLLQSEKHPEIVAVETAAVLQAATTAGMVDRADGELLLAALRLYQGLNHIIRLCVEDPFNPKEAPRGLKELLCRVADTPDFRRLEAHLRETEAAVRACFVKLIGKVAKAPSRAKPPGSD